MNKNSIIFIIIGLIIIGGLVFFFNKPQETDNNPSQTENTDTNPVVTEPPPPAFVEIVIDYKNGVPFEAKSTRVEEGQKVVLKVNSDIADEVHLHGYDISVDVEPGTTATLEFNATNTGRFTAELEDLKKDIAIIEIYPR